MKWIRRWLIRLLVMVVLVGAVRHAYVNGMAASAWHSFEQSVMRRTLEIAAAQDVNDWQARLWQQPAQKVFAWLWARSSPLDREALRRYWRLRQLDDQAQTSGALLTTERMSIFEEGAPLLPFPESDRSPLPAIGR
ncbi:MAG: hypothetical protein BroJett021_41780 [Chloroflexota bacterium]|nr:hypothetical protein [Caldilinea sp.]GIK75190.1 MAG: hypothetical protein BroJett021_41780 [Chloroflexota bacterium]